MAEPRVIVLDKESIGNLKAEQPEVFGTLVGAIQLTVPAHGDGSHRLDKPLTFDVNGETVTIQPADGVVLTLSKAGELSAAPVTAGKEAGPKDVLAKNSDSKKAENQADNEQEQAAAPSAQQRAQQNAEQGQQQAQNAARAQAPTVSINPFGGIGGIFSSLREAVRRDPKAATQQFQAMADKHVPPAAAPAATSESAAAPKSLEQRLATVHGAGQQVLQAAAAVDQYTRNLGITKPWRELAPEQRAALHKDPALQTLNKTLSTSLHHLDKTLAADPSLTDAVGRAAAAPGISDDAKTKLTDQLKSVFGKGGTVEKVRDSLGKQTPRLNPNSEEGRAAQKMLAKLQKVIEEVAKKVEALIKGLFGKAGKRSAAAAPG